MTTVESYVARWVASAPPLSVDQLDRLEAILRPTPLPFQVGDLENYMGVPYDSPSMVRYIKRSVRRQILADPCYYCGGAATQVDHKTPLSRGGAHAPDNWAAACANCNAEKGVLTEDEYQVWKTRT